MVEEKNKNKVKEAKPKIDPRLERAIVRPSWRAVGFDLLRYGAYYAAVVTGLILLIHFSG